MGNEWGEITLADSLEFVVDNRGKTVPACESGIPLIATNCVSNQNLYPEHINVRYVSQETFDTWFRAHPKPGDILLTNKGSKNGAVCLCPDPVGFCIAQDMVGLRANRELIDPLYLFAALRSSLVQNQIKQLNVDSVIPHFKKTDFDKLHIPLPSKKEQERIGEIHFQLSYKIELNRRMNATLEGMAQALFKSWFVDFDPVIDNALAAGNPIPDELAPRAEVRKKALANGTANREAAKAFPAAFQETESMGWIPDGWEVQPLADEVQLTMGQSPSSDHYNYDGNGLPFHQGVTNYGTRFPKHEQFSTGGNRYAEKGDVLFSVRAPVGRINLADRKLIIGRGLAALRHIEDCQCFLVYFLKHTFATEDSIGSGTIFNAVNKKEMEIIPLIVPPDETIRRFEEIANSLDEKIASNAEQTVALTKLRDTLLPKLISGELKPFYSS